MIIIIHTIVTDLIEVWQRLHVFDQVAQGHGAPIVRTLGLQGIPFDFIAKRMDGLTLSTFRVHPMFAAFRHKVAAQIFAPAEILS